MLTSHLGTSFLICVLIGREGPSSALWKRQQWMLQPGLTVRCVPVGKIVKDCYTIGPPKWEGDCFAEGMQVGLHNFGETRETTCRQFCIWPLDKAIVLHLFWTEGFTSFRDPPVWHTWGAPVTCATFIKQTSIQVQRRCQRRWRSGPHMNLSARSRARSCHFDSCRLGPAAFWRAGFQAYSGLRPPGAGNSPDWLSQVPTFPTLHFSCLVLFFFP